MLIDPWLYFLNVQLVMAGDYFALQMFSGNKCLSKAIKYVSCVYGMYSPRLMLLASDYSSPRYDPPTVLSPTMTRSIPSTSFNPIAHLFTITTSISLPAISIRLLAPSDSPSNQLFVASEVITEFAGEDQLTEACAVLIAQIGKMKRTGMGWEDKASFLDFYWRKCK